MDPVTEQALSDLFDGDQAQRNDAFHRLMPITDEPVDWAYEAWDRALAGLTAKDNHVRAVSAQLLCNLAKSDPDGRLVDDFDRLLNVTRDARFVTARHCLQNIWKVGLAGPEQLSVLLAGLRLRYTESFTEKNGTLIRFDIIVGLANLYVALADPTIRADALSWIDEEPDLKYRKKSLGAWKKLTS